MPSSELTGRVIGAAIEVHKALGPGLLESTYQHCIAREFCLRDIAFVQRLPMPVVYKDCQLDAGYALDFLVDSQLVLEIKSAQALHPVHEAQLLTYMKLGGFRLGLLINFNVLLLRDGIKRMVL